MRLHRVLLAVALMAGTVGITPVQDAHATTIAPLTIEQLTVASTYVVEGVVTRVWVEEDEHGRIWTRAAIAVDTVFKGPDAPDELIVDSLGGHDWDRSTVVQAQARFSEHERTLVFLDTIKNGTRLTPSANFHGKFTIRRAPGDTEPHVLRWVGKPNQAFDAQFLPYPSPEKRVYLDELHDSIRGSLTTGWDGESIPGISDDRLKKINTPEMRQIRIVRGSN